MVEIDSLTRLFSGGPLKLIYPSNVGRLAELTDGPPKAIRLCEQKGLINEPERGGGRYRRSEEHTSELQSLMRISYAVFCLKKKHDEYKNHQIHLYTNDT